MSSNELLRRVSDDDWAWFGGLFLGEGCLLVRDRRGIPLFGLSLTIGDEEVTKRLTRLFGGRSAKHSEARPELGIRRAFRWELDDGFVVVEVVRRIRKYLLGHKGRQADAYLRFAETKLGYWQRMRVARRKQYSSKERRRLYELAYAARNFAGGGSKGWRTTWQARIEELRKSEAQPASGTRSRSGKGTSSSR